MLLRSPPQPSKHLGLVVWGVGFRLYGVELRVSGFRVWVSGCGVSCCCDGPRNPPRHQAHYCLWEEACIRVLGLGIRVPGLGFGVWGLGLWVWGLGFGVGVWGFKFCLLP